MDIYLVVIKGKDFLLNIFLESHILGQWGC